MHPAPRSRLGCFHRGPERGLCGFLGQRQSRTAQLAQGGGYAKLTHRLVQDLATHASGHPRSTLDDAAARVCGPTDARFGEAKLTGGLSLLQAADPAHAAMLHPLKLCLVTRTSEHVA